MSPERARKAYLILAKTSAQLDGWTRDFGMEPCGSWLWLDVDAASLAYDNAVALHWAGRRPSFAVRAAGDLV